LQFIIDIFNEIAAQEIEINIASPHHSGRVLIIDQSEQKMLERGIFMVALICESERLVKGLFETARKGWHSRAAFHFFSMTHCRGCWCLRAKSITKVTFVSAIS